MAGIVILSDHSAGKLMLQAALAVCDEIVLMELSSVECCMSDRAYLAYDCSFTDYDIPHWQKLHDRHQRIVYRK